MTMTRTAARLLLAGLLSAIASGAVAAPLWTDSPLARIEALALIQTLNVEILSSSSATLTLERWCRDHDLAQPPVILARRIDQASEAPSATVRHDLGVSSGDSVRYRRVELTCGDHLLSVADNWYVPARLTRQMNRLLDSTQTPFGKVVLPLKPHRETIAVQMLWPGLPDGWERAAPATNPGGASGAAHVPGQPLDLPPALFEHRAILYTPAHQAIAEVREVYQRDLLSFPEPQLP
jgi:hypothetical protein